MNKIKRVVLWAVLLLSLCAMGGCNLFCDDDNPAGYEQPE